MKNKLRATLKSFANPRQYSKLQALVVVIIVAAVGVTYLVASHAATPLTLTLESTNNIHGSIYTDKAYIAITYTDPLTHSTLGAVYSATTDGIHTYHFWYDNNGYPYVSIDSGPVTHISGVGYFYPPANYTQYGPVLIVVDSAPPTVSFSSGAPITTQSSSITITGNTGDTVSGVGTVFINGVQATLHEVTQNPYSYGFTATVPIALGSNSLVATAMDIVGHTTKSAALSVTRQAPKPPPTQTGGSGGGTGGSSGGTTSGGSKGTTSSGSGSSSGSGGSSSGGSSSGGSGSGSSGTAGSTDTGSGSTTTDTSGSSNNGSTIDTTYVANSSTPDVFKNENVKLASSDNTVNVTFPAGTFSTDAFCTIDSTGGSSVPVKSPNLAGPYAINCTDSQGNVLDKINKDLTVDIKTASTGHYKAYTYTGSKWQTTSSTSKSKDINFKLTKLESFAAAPSKSTGSLILNIIGVILVIMVVGFLILVLLRRRQLQEVTHSYYTTDAQ
jgi:uncharacterized membrane protein YgcG